MQPPIKYSTFSFKEFEIGREVARGKEAIRRISFADLHPLS
jgi:hypothetical protein